MAIKTEWVLILSIAVTLLVSFSLKFQDSMHGAEIKKELSFKNTIFTEVDANGVRSFAKVKNGEQVNGILTMNEISFDKIDNTKIAADKALYAKDEIVLSGDVKIQQKNGFTFDTQKAIYNTRQGKITSPGKYHAALNENLMTGTNLSYDTKKQTASSQSVHATLYMQD